MPQYRRVYCQGGTFFFTVVTARRFPFFSSSDNRKMLYSAWLYVQKKLPFETIAYCLLPEHLHCIWTLPEHQDDYSLRWKEIKRLFTKAYIEKNGHLGITNFSQLRRGEGGIWQRRFWEHFIRDDEDMNCHIDYIHYNPVKHALTEQASSWAWSSFQRYVKMGIMRRIGEEISVIVFHWMEWNNGI